MEIKYVGKEVKAIHLGDLESGTVFRPKNSQELYMVCDYTAEDEIFNTETAKSWIQNIQNFDFDDVPQPKKIYIAVFTSGAVLWSFSTKT